MHHVSPIISHLDVFSFVLIHLSTYTPSTWKSIIHSTANGRCFKYKSDPSHPYIKPFDGLPLHSAQNFIWLRVPLWCGPPLFFSIPWPLRPCYMTMPCWFPPHSLHIIHSRAQNIIPQFCMAGSFLPCSLKSHVTWLGWSSIPKVAIHHSTVLPSSDSVSSWHLSQIELLFFSVCLLGYHLSCSMRAGAHLRPSISIASLGDWYMDGAQQKSSKQMGLSAGVEGD